MKIGPLLLLLFCSLFFSACQYKKVDLGVAESYFPEQQLLQKGIVNKYYMHTKQTDRHVPSTNISYRSYKLDPSNHLFYQYYNPAFALEVTKLIAFQNDQFTLLEEERIGRMDTFNAIISKPIINDWKNQTCQSEKIISFNWGSRKWVVKQNQNKDTIILNKPAKIFLGTQIFTQIYQADTMIVESDFRETYVKNIGLFSKEIKNKDSHLKMELVEQIPLSQFQKMASHGQKRIAYIDPAKSMDAPSNFKPCGIHKYIYDYYNGQKAYHYKGGKKEIWAAIKKQLQKDKLFQESGYLTFRFVVNCNGESGYFMIEQADLDFQKKKFAQETIHHLYQIVQQLDGWNPTQIRGEAVDAYFYLTFKLKNGEIIDLLP